MLQIGLGAKKRGGDLSSAFLDCHERIRRMMRITHALCQAPPDHPPDDITSAAAQVSRYFTVALPRHIADEDHSLKPRLVGRDAEVDRALAEMSREHAEHDTEVAHLISLLDRIKETPAVLAELRDELLASATKLTSEFEVHLAREEQWIIPAIGRLLSADEQSTIKTEAIARRAPSP